TSRYFGSKQVTPFLFNQRGNVKAFAVNGKSEERAARTDHHSRAIRLLERGLNNGERWVDYVENNAGLPQMSPALLLGAFPVFRAGRTSVIEANDLFLADGMEV